MKKIPLWAVVFVAGVAVLFASVYIKKVEAAAAYPTALGGTGTSTPSGILYGDNGSTSHLNTVGIGSGCTFVGGTLSCIGTGLTALGSGYATTTGTAVTLSTTTLSFNGLTIGQAITVPNSSNILFTPVWSGTLNNAGLTNSMIGLTDSNSTLTVGGSPASLGGALTATFNLGHSNIWTVLQQFTGNASSTQFSVPNTLYWGSTATSTLTSTGSVGIGTTSPFTALSLDRTQGLASSTISVREYAYGTATSTTELIDCRSASQTHIRIGAAAQALQLNSSSLIPGQKCIVVVENPNGTAGTITWSVTTGAILKWAGGTTPSQTTTANAMDVWSFLMTAGSSTNAILGAATTGF